MTPTGPPPDFPARLKVLSWGHAILAPLYLIAGLLVGHGSGGSLLGAMAVIFAVSAVILTWNGARLHEAKEAKRRGDQLAPLTLRRFAIRAIPGHAIIASAFLVLSFLVDGDTTQLAVFIYLISSALRATFLTFALHVIATNPKLLPSAKGRTA